MTSVSEKLTKKLAEKLMKIKGEARGVSFKNDAEYVLVKKEEAGLKKVEKELEKVGYPIKYKEIRNLDFYPVGLRAISLLAIKKAFGWGDEEMRELGGFATGVSLIVRIYLKFFHSIELLVKKAPQIWGEYFTVGRMAVSDHDVEKKYAVVEVRNFALHPVFCRVLEGYFAKIVKMVVKPKEVKCRETKCTFKGDEFHEFLIKWR